MRLKLDEQRLPILSVLGTVSGARCAGYIVDGSGQASIVPQIGGITYNVRTGDSAFGYAANHVEPGVSITSAQRSDADALQTLSCLGNEAIVKTGDAKGARGIVTGKHLSMEYFAQNVIIDFAPETLDKLAVGDQILVKAQGQGLALTEPPGVRVLNIDPALLTLLDIEVSDGILKIPVVARIPAELMSYKVGIRTTMVDIDLQTDDLELLKRHDLEQLRLGDLVLIEDFDTTYSGSLLRGAVTVGVVVTGDSLRMGHGPGIVAVMSAPKGNVLGTLSGEANIANHFAALQTRWGELP